MGKRGSAAWFGQAVLAVAACFVFFPAVAGAAPIITYSAIDLPDVVAGDDLWRYDYSVSGYSFAKDEGFEVFFSPSLYSDLDASSPHPDWDVLAIQPDPVLPDVGFYSAIANIANPSLVPTFSVTFVWLGPGVPGAQLFTVTLYDPAHDVILESTGRGRTSIPGGAPEPATLILIGCGAGYIGYRRRQRL